MKHRIPYILIITISALLGCQENKTLEAILSEGSAEFQRVLNNPEHEVQIIYGKISDGGIEHQYFGDTSRYFYPASSVKMLAAFAAMKKLESLGLPRETEILIDSSEHHPRVLSFDSLFDQSMTVENLIKKIFVYSDNQAFNVLYGWLGKDYINGLFKEAGIETRVVHQLSEAAFSFTAEANASRTSAILNHDGNFVKSEAEPVIWSSSLNPTDQMKGVGYLKDGEIIKEPFDFGPKNYVPLEHLLLALEGVVDPIRSGIDLGILEEGRSSLKDIMKLLPRDLPAPISEKGDNYVKFFMYGDQEDAEIPKSITYLNKVGWAYGYLTDVAYIRDMENDIEFFLAATIHVNANKTYNDGVYEYEEIGLPFLGELGRLIYNHELQAQ